MELTHRFAIAKLSPEQHIASGWLYVAETAEGEQVIDHSDQYITAADLEVTAYEYVLTARAGSAMHETFYSQDGQRVAECCASVVTTREVQKAWGLQDGAMPVGWWVSYFVTDPELWERIKSGELTMFSIGGSAVSSPDAPEDQAT